ncbi:hypothetical protein WJX84_003388 [Apatococcus fuscideae]|uniref:Uncharacterized protein n=1 Tax=Apatococcus fuscideae TaxID=2026836 RepID=A0AAW1T2R3_9CHLO
MQSADCPVGSRNLPRAGAAPPAKVQTFFWRPAASRSAVTRRSGGSDSESESFEFAREAPERLEALQGEPIQSRQISRVAPVAGNPNLFNVRLLGQACQLAMQPHQRMSLTTQPDQCFIDLMPKALMRNCQR